LLAVLGVSTHPAQPKIARSVIGAIHRTVGANGHESYIAMELARDMINEKGGVGGKKSALSAAMRQIPALARAKLSVLLLRRCQADHRYLCIATWYRHQRRSGPASVIHWETIASAGHHHQAWL